MRSKIAIVILVLVFLAACTGPRAAGPVQSCQNCLIDPNDDSGYYAWVTNTPTPTATGTSTATATPTHTPTRTPTQPSSNYLAGWWEDQNPSAWATYMSTYAARGQNIFLLDGGYCGVSQIPKFTQMVDTAWSYGMKSIVYIRCGSNHVIDGVSDDAVLALVKALQNKPGLAMWELGDEPEWPFSTTAAVRQARADNLKHFYDLIKTVDKDHQIYTSFDFNSYIYHPEYITPFLAGLDIIGQHQYPFYYNTSPLASGTMVNNVWGAWQKGFAMAAANGKGFIPTGQGFGVAWDTAMRNPTYDELRFQMYSSIIQGAPLYLWWMDTAAFESGLGTGSPVSVNVGRLTNELRNIPGIQNGVTAQSGSVYYRTYGSYIVALNLSAVTVTVSIPAKGTSASVLNENRSITVTSGNIVDAFTKFAVHIYLLR